MIKTTNQDVENARHQQNQDIKNTISKKPKISKNQDVKTKTKQNKKKNEETRYQKNTRSQNSQDIK